MNRQEKKACFRDEHLIEAVISGINPKKKKRLRLHLESCGLCRRKFLLLAELREYLQSNLKDKDLPRDQVDRLKQQARLLLAELEGKRTSRMVGSRTSNFRWLLPFFLGLIFISISVWLFWLRPERPGLRDSAAASVHLLSPVGKIASFPIEFRWERLEGAKSYQFILADENLILIHSQKTATPHLILPITKRQAIKKRSKYIWIVEALDETEQVIVSASSFFLVE